MGKKEKEKKQKNIEKTQNFVFVLLFLVIIGCKINKTNMNFKEFYLKEKALKRILCFIMRK